MKIFVLGVPHTQTSPVFSTCAFTMKAYNLCRMLIMRGHEVIHIGTEGSTVPCTKHISVADEKTFRALYGEDYPNNKFYPTQEDGPYARYMALWGAKARAALVEHMDADWTNIACCTWGGAQKAATKDLPQFAVESGVGYKHTWTKFRVFESYAWLHTLYGHAGKFDGNAWMDCVIPNAFDPDMFEFREKKEDSLLFMGRLNTDKGVALAVEIAGLVGKKIKVCGQGDPAPFMKPWVEYVPPVGVEGRKALMAEAAALLCPTFYLEPFGGVAVEAQMSGTPVICTDWGAFPETVIHGITGFRCKTLEQFVWAAKNLHTLKPANCRAWAETNFSLARIGQMYEEYFQQVLTLKNKGWQTINPSRENLDYLKKVYPPTAND